MAKMEEDIKTHTEKKARLEKEIAALSTERQDSVWKLPLPCLVPPHSAALAWHPGAASFAVPSALRHGSARDMQMKEQWALMECLSRLTQRGCRDSTARFCTS